MSEDVSEILCVCVCVAGGCWPAKSRRTQRLKRTEVNTELKQVVVGEDEGLQMCCDMLFIQLLSSLRLF